MTYRAGQFLLSPDFAGDDYDIDVFALRRGLSAQSAEISSGAVKSSEYGVLPRRDGAGRKDGDAR